MGSDDRARAQRVILEIIRQAGGELHGATKLYKMFYWAHRYFAEDSPGYLSDWPIVLMPHGPGIDQAKSLLRDLQVAGVLRITPEASGLYALNSYRLTGDPFPGEHLDEDAIRSIRRAVEHVLPMTAVQASENAHQESRSWRSGLLGQQLNIYIDHIPDEEFESRRQGLLELNREIAAAFDDEDL